MHRLDVRGGALLATAVRALAAVLSVGCEASTSHDGDTAHGAGASAAEQQAASGATGGSSAGGDSGNGGQLAGGGKAGDPATGGSGGTEACLLLPSAGEACPDGIEESAASQFGVTLEVPADTTLSEIAGVSGETALRLETQAGFLVTLRYDAPAPIDASAADQLRLLLRAQNDNIGWQGNVPALTIEDADGLRRSYTPPGVLLPSDGQTWVELRVPLAGGSGYVVVGDELDWAHVSALELSADTWDAGFVLDVDGLGFVSSSTLCAVDCPNGCNGRGSCDPIALGCVCEVGATGHDCSSCLPGFELESGHCQLENDGDYDYWPNPVSGTNGDPWLAVHHQELKTLHPRVLVLNFVNPSSPPLVEALIDDIIAGFREGSRALGYENEEAEPALDYELVGLVDLRDGVDGRPAAPLDYEYENGTLFPRRGEAEPGDWRFDYATLFEPDFAAHYGFENPDSPGDYLSLCELVDSGQLHELWIVGSGDVPDVNAAEVLEFKQRYDRGRNPIADSFEPCAGNGCFDSDVPRCERSVRIGFVNYNRGPGCYLHSQGHGLESVGRRAVVPALSDWFVPLAGFDLDSRYGLLGQSFYELIGEGDSASYPSLDELLLDRDGSEQLVKPYVASCGNVHFPPNAGSHYDYTSSMAVDSSCRDFGRNVLECRELSSSPLSADNWAAYEALAPDCGGAFLVYWLQSMPGLGSGQYFGDGRPMLSLWPFLFY